MTSTPDAPARFSTPPVLITGMSGGGLSSAAKVLEDKGFFVVQNLPRQLIAPFLEAALAQDPPVEKVAFLTDVRSRGFGGSLREVLKDLTARGMRPTILFMDARDDVLIRRFDSVRRTHPLQGEDTLQAGIDRERALTQPIKELADIVIDASDLSVHDLRRAIEASFGTMAHNQQHVTIQSFGFKHGSPRDADLMVDVRFLPNPFWIPELRGFRGTDAPVSEYVLSQEGAGEFLDRFVDMFRSMLAGYRHEGKNFITVAVGCTGGHHRSVAVSEELKRRLSELPDLDVNVFHRDIARD
ncbi:glmZ(sRNA)-inactivating NTPase [Corynebacterium humireducens NBRC 106098 = DSM 45392]|uniref:GlmZ(SRNA)-inactivating NTPase n=1 Tax=Corynebacterium humireducens NBRC 106098 = DSM 45392 TaxID=1223515 RepID=A0A0B5DBX2_9CORY|nr:RNase adapter RapZ [Corynebacterium humireducens]AJE33259.1 glmZ(sRNA)-inactivating NTPase [Corynebacterium humireducens NBRC 106098 = DSM 45392]